MTTHRLINPMLLLSCLTACDPSLADDDQDNDDDASDESGSPDESDASDEGHDTSDEDPDTSGGTGDPGDALPASVFLYLHDDGGWADSVHAYDVATNQTWLVTDLGGDVQIRSLAIHPDRTTLAISAPYELESADESEGIWRVAIGGGEPEEIMDAVSGGGEGQDIADLAYTWDGAEIWFGYSNGNSGGGLIGRVAAGGGEPEYYGDSNGSCLAQVAPSPGPSGMQMVAVRTDCSDLAQEGLVVHDLPPTSAGQVVLTEGVSSSFGSVPPQWSADGTAVMFVMNTLFDLEGDGVNDGQGDTLLVYDTAGGQVFEVVPPSDDQRIYSFAISPDETGIVMCMASAAGQDLVLLDLSGETATYRNLTSDGMSCRVAW